MKYGTVWIAWLLLVPWNAHPLTVSARGERHDQRALQAGSTFVVVVNANTEILTSSAPRIESCTVVGRTWQCRRLRRLPSRDAEGDCKPDMSAPSFAHSCGHSLSVQIHIQRVNHDDNQSDKVRTDWSCDCLTCFHTPESAHVRSCSISHDRVWPMIIISSSIGVVAKTIAHRIELKHIHTYFHNGRLRMIILNVKKRRKKIDTNISWYLYAFVL